MKTFYIEIFGCQMNKLDGQILASLFEKHGFKTAQNPKTADVVVFLGCSVRQHAEDRLLSRVGRLKKAKFKNPKKVIAIAGCIAQIRQKQLFSQLPFVDILVGPGDLVKLPEMVESILADNAKKCFSFQKHNNIDQYRIVKKTLSAFVRIIQGCSRACSYCVVPLARGKAFSRNPDSILNEIQKLADAGCKEVILIGQDVSAYHYNGIKLPQLLNMAASINGIARIAFVTSHPLSVSTQLLETIADNPKISQYLHMPAQSGSNRILKLMKRGYSAQQYQKLVKLARSICTNIEIASDFIVGFPSESEHDFNHSLKLIYQCSFINSYIFKYSPRPNTPASQLHDNVPSHIKKERLLKLLKAQQEVSLQRKKNLLGKTVRVLVDSYDKKNNLPRGKTWNNHIVVFKGKHSLGQIVSVKIEKVSPSTAFGKSLQEEQI